MDVHPRLYAFCHNTFLQIAAFTCAINQETEQVQMNLVTPPWGHST